MHELQVGEGQNWRTNVPALAVVTACRLRRDETLDDHPVAEDIGMSRSQVVDDVSIILADGPVTELIDRHQPRRPVIHVDIGWQTGRQLNLGVDSDKPVPVGCDHTTILHDILDASRDVAELLWLVDHLDQIDVVAINALNFEVQSHLAKVDFGQGLGNRGSGRHGFFVDRNGDGRLLDGHRHLDGGWPALIPSNTARNGEQDEQKQKLLHGIPIAREVLRVATGVLYAKIINV